MFIHMDHMNLKKRDVRQISKYIPVINLICFMTKEKHLY